MIIIKVTVTEKKRIVRLFLAGLTMGELFHKIRQETGKPISRPTIRKILAQRGYKYKHGTRPVEEMMPYRLLRKGIHAYKKKFASLAEVAAIWNCTAPTARKILMNHGVKMRPRGGPNNPTGIGLGPRFKKRFERWSRFDFDEGDE